MAIVAIVGLYEVVSTILDFQFTQAIVLFSLDDAARSQNFATVYATTNWAAMFIQLLLTSFVMRRFGLGVALLILPCAIAMSSTGFIVFPTLIFGGLLSVSDNAFSYSINQSSKEALYVPNSVEEKYQAKAFIEHVRSRPEPLQQERREGRRREHFDHAGFQPHENVVLGQGNGAKAGILVQLDRTILACGRENRQALEIVDRP